MLALRSEEAQQTLVRDLSARVRVAQGAAPASKGFPGERLCLTQPALSLQQRRQVVHADKCAWVLGTQRGTCGLQRLHIQRLCLIQLALSLQQPPVLNRDLEKRARARAPPSSSPAHKMLTTRVCHNVYSATAASADVLVTFEAPSAAGSEAEEAPRKKKGRKGLKEAPPPPKAASPPVYLACALDVSGSMSGQNLREVQQTMLYIASTL